MTNCIAGLYSAAVRGVKPAFRHYAQLRGSAVHATIHRLHTEGGWDEARDLFREEWLLRLGAPGPPVNADEQKLAKEFDDWGDAVEQYALREREAEVAFSELRLRGTVRSLGGRGYEVEGTVDQLRRRPDGGMALYEIKTNATPPTPAVLERNIQLALYGWCLNTGEAYVDGRWVPAIELCGGPVNELVHYQFGHLIPYRRNGRRGDGSTYSAGSLRGDPCYRVTKTPEQLAEGARSIARIIAAIRAGGFFWNPSATYGGCDACPVRHACGRGLATNAGLAPETLKAA